jgi:hypothetical protein
MDLKFPLLNTLRVSLPNIISTMLSQLAMVGVKWKTTLPWVANHSSHLKWIQ